MWGWAVSNVSHIFREYDIRGIAERELSETLVADLGTAFALHIQALRNSTGPMLIVTGRDGRHSSPALGRALATGLARGGSAGDRLWSAAHSCPLFCQPPFFRCGCYHADRQSQSVGV